MLVETRSRTELACLRVVASALVVFGVYGFATGAPSTVAYLLVVSVVAIAAAVLWKPDTPPWLAVGLTVLAVAHLAGGLVRVGDDVLYNASFARPAFRYDHLVHASGVCLGTLALWHLLGIGGVPQHAGRHTVLLVVLGGLGLGALNETIEFLTTTAHAGAHVGGYENTGWDLVSNVAGALVAAVVIRRPA